MKRQFTGVLDSKPPDEVSWPKQCYHEFGVAGLRGYVGERLRYLGDKMFEEKAFPVDVRPVVEELTQLLVGLDTLLFLDPQEPGERKVSESEIDVFSVKEA